MSRPFKPRAGAFWSLARRLQLGRLFRLLVHNPVSKIREATSPAGRARRHLDAFRHEMNAAARSLPPPTTDLPETDFAITYLLGHRYVDQAIYCHRSLCHHAKLKIPVEIVDDGTLTDKDVADLKRTLPNLRIDQADTIEQEVLDRFLPRERFPALRAYRDTWPLLRKLTDLHAGHQGWRLLLDADQLFFAHPEALLEACRNRASVYMIDVAEAYGYSRERIDELAGTVLPPKINIGVFGLQSEAIDWDQVEFWIKTLVETEGRHYNITQCLCAMVLAQGEPIALDAEAYKVLPSEEDCRRPTQILHHYVADSKLGYFRNAWRIADRQIRESVSPHG